MTDKDGRPERSLSGAHLRLVNGLGATVTANGLGNLIVDDNEPHEGENVHTGSHYVVVGPWHDFSRFVGLVVGDFNTTSGDIAAVSGGSGNTAAGEFFSVSGGHNRTAAGEFDGVAGSLFEEWIMSLASRAN